MALATQCPHCHTTFRVASDQLKLRGGIVRCGACQSIFDGSAHLIDLDALAASKEQAAQAAAPDAAAPALDEQGEQPVYTLDFDSGKTFDSLDILPKAETEEAAAAPRAQVWRNGGGMLSAAELDEAEPAPHADADADMPADDVTDLVTDDLPPVPEAASEADTPDAEEAPHEAEAIVAEPEPEPGPEPEPEPGTALADADADADTDTEAVPADPPASAYAPQGRVEPSFDLPVDEELVAQPLPDDEHAYQDEAPAAATGAAMDADDIPLPLRASAASNDSLAPAAPAPAPKSARAKALEARNRRSKLTPTKIEAPKLRVPVAAEADEPEFVKRSRKQEQSGRTRRLLMVGGAVLLALLLAAQLVTGFRNVLAARYPGARPVLNAGCAVLRCRIGLPTQIENLAIETGELSTLGVDTYSLNTLLRNQGSLVQAWPSIQLELTDANDKPLLRRVFGPAEYLPQGVSSAAGFGARSEQPVRLNFALTGLKPSSYHMIVFYP
jgi:predicted Zn finger-like uncharacterized protein